MTPGQHPERGEAEPTALPAVLADARPIAFAGTLAWFVAAVVLVAVGVDGTWLWTCVAGTLVGVGGSLLMRWQRGAARRGARGAWLGLR